MEKWLAGVPLFASLSEAAKQQLAERLVPRTFEKGAFLTREGEEGEWAYIVIAGQVRVFRTTAEGGEFVLAHWGPGQAVGLVAVSVGDSYPASAMATQPTSVLALHRRDLEALQDRLPGFAVNVAKAVGGRARAFAERLVQDATLDAKGKLAALLLALADEGRQVPGGVLVAADLTNQDLGNMCGMTRETVSRTLSAWKKDGWVELQRKGMILKDQAALAKLAGQA